MKAKTQKELSAEIEELRTRLKKAKERLRTLREGNKGMLKEIAHLKKKNKTLAQLASFPELNPNPVMEVDLAGNVHYSNPAVNQLFPDFQTIGPRHPYLSDLSSLTEMFKCQGKSSIIRELKINNSWYEQAIYHVSKNNRLRIYGHDITERKRAEQEHKRLRIDAENERRRLEAVMDALPVGVAVTDAQGGNIRSNKAFDQIWGSPRPRTVSIIDYAAYKAWWSDTGKPVAPEEWASAQAVQKGEVIVGQLLEIQRFDGSHASVINSGAPIFDVDGKIAGCAVAVQDVTDLRKAEQALGESEERLRRMIETSPVAIGFGDSTGKIFDANESFYRLTGYTREEIHASQLGWDRLTAPEYAELDRQIMATLATTGSAGPYEKEYIRKDGNRVPLLLSVSKLPGRDEHIAFIVDITERKRAEEALRESEERYRSLTENVPSILMRYDKNLRVLYLSPKAEEITGIPSREFIGKTNREAGMAEHLCDLWEDAIREVFHTGQNRDLEFDFPRQKGTKTFYLKLAPEWGPDGTVNHVLGISTDITERKRAEQERERLRAEAESERRRLEAVMEALPIGVAITDTKGGTTRFNSAYDQVWRGPRPTPQSVSEYAAYKAWWVETGKPVAQEDWAASRAIQKGQAVLGQLMNIQRFDGSRASVINSAAPIFDADGKIAGCAVAIQDITDLREAEEALRKSKAKFELLSETASNLLATDKPQEVVNDLCQKLMTYLDCDVFINYLVDEERQRLHLNAYAGIPEKTGKEIEWLDYGVAVCGCAARDACRIVAEDIPNTPDPRTDLVKSFGIKAYACHPLFSAGRVIGTLSFGTRSRSTFTEDEISLMKTVADQVAIAMERTQLIERIRRSRDELENRVQERTTELANAYKELKEQSRILGSFFKYTVTPLVFLDRDFNFIRVNEAYAKACQREVSEFTGHNHFEFYPSDAKAKFEQVVQTKEPYVAVAKPFTFPDHPEWGDTYWDWTLTPIIDDAGEVEFLVFSLRDVTKRKRAEEAVKVERQRLNDVLEKLPVYVALLEPDYHIPFANRVFRERFGESHGRRCFESMFERSEPCEICETYTVLKTMSPHEWEWTGPDGRNYDVFDFPFTDTDGSTLILEMGIDITERKQTEEQLKTTSLYARSLIEASLDPLVTISKDGKIMDVNSATELITGVPRNQLIGSDFLDYFTEPEKAREGYQQVFKTGSVRDYPLSIRHTSGRITDVLYNATLYRNEVGEVQGVFAAARDITKRKQAEEALKESESRLRSLSSQLLTVQENERKRVARELHDGIGQLLTAIKFKVENIFQEKGERKTGAKEKSLEDIIPMIKESIEEVRRIQMDLRPSILDDLGILATLEWFYREYQKIYSHIYIEKKINLQESDVSLPLKTAIYRVTQEAMNNIAKHSQADSVHLSLRRKGDKIELTIKDNGMGFDLGEILSPERSKKGLGLNSMRERTELLGGTFEIESTKGRGTVIRASWPL